jgi:hypothetical protein
VLARALVLVLFVTGTAFAQVGSGTLTGIVRDQSRAGIPGVTVAITDLDTNRQRIAVSSADGVYAATSLPPGRYRLEVEFPGFKSVTRDGIRVTTGDITRIDVEMAVGAVTDRVVVTADAPALRSETASLGQAVQQERIGQLPLNGRTFITLAALAPGVALPPNSQFPRINGGRPRTNEYLFDGISVLQPEPGQVAYFPVVDPSRSSRSRATACPPSSGASTAG